MIRRRHDMRAGKNRGDFANDAWIYGLAVARMPIGEPPGVRVF